MKQILLIGATGFVGSAILSELLRRGHKVTAAVRLLQKKTSSREYYVFIANRPLAKATYPYQ